MVCVGSAAINPGHAQVSESTLHCLCKQKNQSSDPRMLTMCVGHYQGEYYTQRCGSDSGCLANTMNNGSERVVQLSRCSRAQGH